MNHMPAHKDILGEPRIHVLAAYVYGLSRGEPGKRSIIPINAVK